MHLPPSWLTHPLPSKVSVCCSHASGVFLVKCIFRHFRALTCIEERYHKHAPVSACVLHQSRLLVFSRGFTFLFSAAGMVFIKQRIYIRNNKDQCLQVECSKFRWYQSYLCAQPSHLHQYHRQRIRGCLSNLNWGKAHLDWSKLKFTCHARCKCWSDQIHRYGYTHQSFIFWSLLFVLLELFSIFYFFFLFLQILCNVGLIKQLEVS